MDNRITSDSIIEIEQHFRISAGPGAGKTHWLVNHIKNILHNSDRLGKSQKIACITYTNVAVNTIVNRLGRASYNVEVGTIHSFLYKHVVKPYLRFIANEYGVNAIKVDGHEEITVGRSMVIEWVSNSPNKNRLRHPYSENQLTKIPNYTNALINWVSSIRFKFDADGELILLSNRKRAVSEIGENIIRLNNYCLDVLEPNLIELKKKYWAKGLLHHDDILFFSFQLILKFPFILNVLRSKFPYFFVDEFQDSNPIQVKILNLIGQSKTIVGVIGDKAQSIYGFQGAELSQFDDFDLSELKDYYMQDNRRSTNEIIDFLDHLRPDFLQNKFNNCSGEKPTIIIGDAISSLEKCKRLIGEETLCTLAYTNIISNIMKRESGVTITSDLLRQLSSIDTNRERMRVISSFVKATEYARNGRYKDAIKEIKTLKRIKSEYKDVKQCLLLLQVLLGKYDSYIEQSLTEFYALVKVEVPTLANLRKGKAQDFYFTNTYQQLAVCVNIVDDDSLNRTIHKAKGDEFDNVMLILKKEEDLKFISNPDLNKEEYRVMYVAASRAKKRLFISTPTLSIDNEIRPLLNSIIELRCNDKSN